MFKGFSLSKILQPVKQAAKVARYAQALGETIEFAIVKIEQVENYDPQAEAQKKHVGQSETTEN